MKRRRSPPDPQTRANTRFDDIKPDPSRIGGVAVAPFVRLPDPATLFAARGRRFATLAADNTIAPYLAFLGCIASAQADCVAALPPPTPISDADIARRVPHGFPPISVEKVRGDTDFAATLSCLLDRVARDADQAALPPEVGASRASLAAMDERRRFDLAADMFEGAYAAELVGESLFLAAALQVHLAKLASLLPATAVTPSTASGIASGLCPVCGAAPVSSVVVGWTQASKARYCACSLCGTLWNHVRIRCTACGTTTGIAYYTIEDGPATIGVEACTSCRCYIKHMQQHEDTRLDPVADDVASFALDQLAREEGFRRAGLNPLFLTL